MNINEIAVTLRECDKKIILIYAFNATGKTRLSVEYKDITKSEEEHAGVYYNAYSEDIFTWDNDTENNEENIRLRVNKTKLNKYHSSFTELDIRKHLSLFNPTYEFEFVLYEDYPDRGIEYIKFYSLSDEEKNNIKISRGEERIFVWCFFLTLFEVDELSNKQSEHFFIDDPVSSLDDHNLFITASSLFDLIQNHHQTRKIIITTHHFGFFNTLGTWLTKGEKKDKFKDSVICYVLKNNNNELELKNIKNEVFLYHLYILKTLKDAKPEFKRQHLVMVRQLLENIASFLGVGRFSYVLDQLEIKDSKTSDYLNSLSHQNIFQAQSDVLNEWETSLIEDVIDQLEKIYNFKIS
jgi:hypothetical protein